MLSGALSRGDGRVEVESHIRNSRKTHISSVWRGASGLTGTERDLATELSSVALLTTIVPAALGGSATLGQKGAGAFLYELRMPSAQFFWSRPVFRARICENGSASACVSWLSENALLAG